MFFSKTANGFIFPEVTNNLPADAVEISDDLYLELLDHQKRGTGYDIGSDAQGYPIKIEAPAQGQNQITKNEIINLENLQTPRRIREAVLGIDNGWLAGIEAQIEALRAQLGVE